MKSLRSVAVTLAIAASLIPAFAFAQQYVNCGTTWQNWGTTNCTPGNLLVYVQVNNNDGATRVPADFTATVNAPLASPTSFPGSLSGTSVLVGGSYTVNVLQQQGYSASYSTGCTGTLSQNSSATCIVTESNVTGYNNIPYSYYPNQYYSTYYPYNNGYVPPLTCAPSGQTVTVGQNVTFTAQGGEFSQYNWSNSAQPNQTSYNIGRVYTTTLLSPGTQTINVYNGSQTATCSITVVGYPVAYTGYNNGYPGGIITPVSAIYPGTAYPNQYPNVTVTPTYVPSLPNTGFAPMDAATLATVLAVLFAAALAAYPYVRKAFAIVLQ